MATIKKSKVDALYDHLSKDGETDPETIAGVLGLTVDDTDDMEAYFRAVNKRKEAEELDSRNHTAPIEKVVFLHTDNTVEELEIVKIKGGKVFVQKAVKRDLVKLIIRGKETVVDCEELRALPSDQRVDPHGASAAVLLTAAELAR